MKTAPGAAWLVVALLAIGIGLDLRVALRGDRGEISSVAMARAREAILAERKPGDLIVHSPLFSPAELSGLGDLTARPDLPAPELRASRRVLVLDFASNRMFGFGGGAKTAALDEGLELRSYEPSGDRASVLFDLYTDLARAELRIERPRGTVTSRCTAPRSEGGRSCPGEAEWLYLAQRQLGIEGHDTPCIWAHPTTGGDLVITLPAQPEPPPGRKLILKLSAGLTDDAVRTTADGAEVRTGVEQAGVTKGSVIVPNRTGWFRSDVTVAGALPIELRISTARDGRRHHCINAQIVESGP